MAERVLVDNDIVIKVASWRLGSEMLASTTLEGVPPALLGVARYVVWDRLAKANHLVDRYAATAAFNALLEVLAVVEPTDEEIADAADFELAAVASGLELDPGESQLLAILIRRDCDALLTGDKRAIHAMERIAPKSAFGRVACLEQLITDVVRRDNVGRTRIHVCSEPTADRAITTCFACSSSAALKKSETIAGLSSYCEHLRVGAPSILLPGQDLSALAS